MNKGWPLVALAEVAQPIARTIPVVSGQTYRTIGVKWWGEGAYERQTIDGSETAAKTLNVVRENDLIINKIWVRHGSTAIASSALDGCAGSGEFPTFELDQSAVVPRWLHWLTKTRGFWNSCDRLSQGTSGKNRIRPELFLSIKIPLPPLCEQQRIVARIEDFANRIERVWELRQQVMTERDALVTSLHVSLSGDRTVRLCDVLELYEDQASVTEGGSYPQVGVKGFGQGLFPKMAVEASQTTYRLFNRLYAGAIVLSQVKGWEGAIAVCPPHLTGWYVSPEYRTFRCLPGQADPEYLSSIITKPWFWTRLQDATRGVGARRERTRPEQFLKLEIPMPVIEQQQYAVQIIARMRRLEPLQAQVEEELNLLLPSILDRASRGEL